MLFSIVIERDPLRWADLPVGLVLWLQAAGGFAALGLLLWLLLGLPRMRQEERKAIPGWESTLFVITVVLAVLGYAVYAVAALAGARGAFPYLALTIAGACALFAVAMPFVLGLFRLRFRRIYALAKLSFKEAIRRRVLYAFSGILLVFLFASWFIPSQTAPKDEV